jgi:Cu(I)/Ag(I) efflux system membrane protein CusA/SilA
MGETEFMVRGLGYIKSIKDLRQIAVGVDSLGTPILLRDVAHIHLGPELRRGVLDWNGKGDTVGGIVEMRYGENALKVIERVKAKLATLQKSLPKGIVVQAGYDRSGLIERAIHNLKSKLIEEMSVVALICILFLLHFRSAFVALFTIPVGVLMAFIIMYPLGINANIMSLGGIALAIGVMVDASVVMVENAHKHLERDKGKKPFQQIILEASKEVGPALFFSLLIITISFVPVFSLTGQSGRLFKPLAYTKTFAMAASSFLAITIIPVLMSILLREHTLDPEMHRRRKIRIWISATAGPILLVIAAGIAGISLPNWSLLAAMALSGFALIFLYPQRMLPEDKNPIARICIRLYRPVIRLVLRWRKTTVLLSLVFLAATVYPARHLGSEFMPPLNEGSLLYMPTTLPGISITKARELLQQTDRIIKSFPEVKSVYGKVGRAETALDPAPLSMIETTIMLYPKVEYEKIPVKRFFSDWPGWLKAPLAWIWPEVRNGKILHEWKKKPIHRFFSDWPGWLKAPLAWIWPEERFITINELSDAMNEAIHFPGLTNAWTMPIRTRIDMLSTGIKTPIGIKLIGPNLNVLSDLGEKIEAVVRGIPGTRSVYAERVTGGNYMDFTINRHEIARYGLTISDVEDVIKSAIGGMNVTTTVEGLERYPVNLRYPRELRDNIQQLKRVLIPTPSGAQVPLAQLATLSIHKGPAVIKTENARNSAWIYIDLTGIDIGTYVARAQRIVNEKVTLPVGYTLVWTGQYKYMMEAKKTLKLIIPMTLALIFILLFVQFKNVPEAAIVMISIPFALIGGIWLLYLLHYNLSVAVVVGFIALAGLATETGVVMLVYLDEAYQRRQQQGRMKTPRDLNAAVIEGAAERVRPILMTASTTLIGLLPVMVGTETGSQVMKRIAAPMVGGLVTSTILTLLLIPVIYDLWKRRDRNLEKE